MATLEDKILGNKMQNYCSSSEDEDDDSKSGGDERKPNEKGGAQPLPPPIEDDGPGGYAKNTGPKGVIKDWERYKEMEAVRRDEKIRERLVMIQKMSEAHSTRAEDAKQQQMDELDAELNELLSEEFLMQFQQQRMMEMLAASGQLPTFGKLVNLVDGGEFLKAVDDENPSVTVIIHIYENYLNACKVMNHCFEKLAKAYTKVKFCKIVGSAAGLSQMFKLSGVPALIAYKGGVQIATFIRITDELSNHFLPSDVEAYLTEHGVLPDKNNVPELANLQVMDIDEDIDVDSDSDD